MSNINYLKIKIARATKENDFPAAISFAKASGELLREEARNCKIWKNVYSCIYN